MYPSILFHQPIHWIAMLDLGIVKNCDRFYDTGTILGTRSPAERTLRGFGVVSGRIELPTHGFSVHCSTI